MTPLQHIKEIERQLTLARLQRSHLAALIYTLTPTDEDARNLLIAQLHRIAEYETAADKLLDALYDQLAGGSPAPT